MILINTTFYVEASADAEFRQWVRDSYLPSALSQEGFTRPVFTRLMLEPQEGMTGYAVQITAADEDSSTRWHDGHGGELRASLCGRFGQRILFFTTYMEEIPL